MDIELRPGGIRVNAVATGPTRTPILERAGFSREMLEASNAQLTAQMPLGRLGNPDEVARWVVELADSPTWVTGQVLSVDGGLAVA
ncbi:SDR family oxidoreductase [Lujinxingia vulgaris]|uniref:SDR family oxidoreductase n=1 Tax=Lujinxingia vulgaris TaxID=2600176 RepID=A0A5C6XB86_9DELT|nr:SDR family oxidoreductase [Lujinxingia vulgaris]